MNWYDLVGRYYRAGFYTNDQVKVFVVNQKITEEQYEEITGEPYL
ncbi:XkdX family protein [Rossellomorea sp. BNER]|nr:XkdX family protein [Rossellomorea sp. BNER]